MIFVPQFGQNRLIGFDSSLYASSFWIPAFATGRIPISSEGLDGDPLSGIFLKCVNGFAEFMKYNDPIGEPLWRVDLEF